MAVPCGSIQMLLAHAPGAFIGCGLFDPTTFERFGTAAARISSSVGATLKTIDDLLNGVVRDANRLADQKGVQANMPARQALERMLS
jgi:uncharacterized protein YunC (DUF1805 family)